MTSWLSCICPYKQYRQPILPREKQLIKCLLCSSWWPFELLELSCYIMHCNKYHCLHSIAEPNSCKSALFLVFLIILVCMTNIKVENKKQETLYHILYQCSYSRRFWNDFESYWYLLTNQQVRLSLQNVIFGIISKQCPSTHLLNYFIIVGKLFLWDCRRNQIKPTIKGYQNKIANKYETESKIKKNDYFEKKMDI